MWKEQNGEGFLAFAAVILVGLVALPWVRYPQYLNTVKIAWSAGNHSDLKSPTWLYVLENKSTFLSLQLIIFNVLLSSNNCDSGVRQSAFSNAWVELWPCVYFLPVLTTMISPPAALLGTGVLRAVKCPGCVSVEVTSRSYCFKSIHPGALYKQRKKDVSWY